jgi:hypothetical protein
MGEEAGSSRGAEGAVRVLGAIGPAAKDAVPDLRRWAASNGDPNGLARAALTKIGASDR